MEGIDVGSGSGSTSGSSSVLHRFDRFPDIFASTWDMAESSTLCRATCSNKKKLIEVTPVVCCTAVLRYGDITGLSYSASTEVQEVGLQDEKGEKKGAKRHARVKIDITVGYCCRKCPTHNIYAYTAATSLTAVQQQQIQIKWPGHTRKRIILFI